MIYQIIYSQKANLEITEFKKSDFHIYKKLLILIKELHEHPRTGTGKPELLKYGKYKGLWSRRITSEHRLIYLIKDKEIIVSVLSVKGHYD